jgi:hypothetical protein
MHEETLKVFARPGSALEMYRRQLSDAKIQRRLQRFDRRLLDVAQ